MDGNAATMWTRMCAGLLCAICALALAPAMLLAYAGLLWLPALDGLGLLSAAALVAGPLPLAVGAVLAWRTARGRDGRSLPAGACLALLAVPLYAVAWTWGGRMLL